MKSTRIECRFPDGSFTLCPVRSPQMTPEERAEDYKRLAAACMDKMDVHQAGIYLAWADYETGTLNQPTTIP